MFDVKWQGRDLVRETLMFDFIPLGISTIRCKQPENSTLTVYLFLLFWVFTISTGSEDLDQQAVEWSIALRNLIAKLAGI